VGSRTERITQDGDQEIQTETIAKEPICPALSAIGTARIELLIGPTRPYYFFFTARVWRLADSLVTCTDMVEPAGTVQYSPPM